MTLPVCGPLNKQAYKFTVKLLTVPEVNVREFFGDEGGTAIVQGASRGVYDVNLMIHVPQNSLPPPPPGGWAPAPNKHVKEDVPGTQWSFIWGYEQNGPNGYVHLLVEIS